MDSGQGKPRQIPMPDALHPRLLFCHFPFGKDPEAISQYMTAHRYDGIEWSLDGTRVMVARSRRQQMIEELRRAAFLCSLHAPYTDLEIGHRDAEYAAAAVRVLQQYIDAAVDLGAHHVNLHLGSFAPEPEELSWETILFALRGYDEGDRRDRACLCRHLSASQPRQAGGRQAPGRDPADPRPPGSRQHAPQPPSATRSARCLGRSAATRVVLRTTL